MSPMISPECWLEHIAVWKQTNLTQADYCRTHNLSAKQFWYWKRKLQGSDSIIKQQVTSGFAVAQFETVTTHQHPLSVTLTDGTILNDIHAENIHIATQLLEALR